MTEGTLVGFSTIALPEMQAANTLAVNNIHDNQNLTQTRLNETKNDDIHIGNIVLYLFHSSFIPPIEQQFHFVVFSTKC